MESIILNLLNLTGEERAAFAVLAPQRFHPDGDGLTVEDWQSAQVILGNPPPECLRGSTALRWLHTRSAGVDPYTAPGVLPSEAALTCSTGAYGHSVSEHLFALLLALMKRLPSYRDQQNRALWRDLGPVKTLLGAQVLVVGTGDLSELALGWATYNGDHMSMYGVNAGVPKTLVRHLVRYEADIAATPALKEVLLDILDTPVSPELLPAKDNGEIAQRTEDLVGPYELHDFYLYYVLRFGFGPAKIFRLARAAFAGREEYPDAVLYKWLRNFYWRFFAQQFKRSCLPDGPKIGSVTLSPRGDWRMPSDACAALWLAELEQLFPQKDA